MTKIGLAYLSFLVGGVFWIIFLVQIALQVFKDHPPIALHSAFDYLWFMIGFYIVGFILMGLGIASGAKKKIW